MVSKLSEKSIVIPGVIVADSSYTEGENTIKTDRGVVSTRLGIVSYAGKKVSVIPHSGPYKPRKGDFVIGLITGYGPNGWLTDIGAITRAFLPVAEVIRRRRYDPRIQELSEILKIGEMISVKVIEAGRLGYPILTMKDSGLQKITNARYVKVKVSKIPRIIGKKGSMLKLLKEGGKAKIFIGQNGVIAVIGSLDSYHKIVQAINLIVEKTFAHGLTSEVAASLSS
ncbi:MAG: S1 RNA-binding domain-containing protein [Nitrososphaeria archaeon]|nr:S1 RNA-binding domain-containing protein [Nitrososphaeria archaeon]